MYLVTLKFRAFPLSLSLSSPNLLSQEFIPFDGPLAFAEYYKTKLSTSSDWRIQYLEDTLTSKELEWNSEIRSSYLLPAIRENNSLIVTTPMGFEVKFSVGNDARYESSERHHLYKAETSQIFLRLGRRDDIIKTALIRKQLGVKLNVKSLPNSQSGPYKAVDYQVKIYATNLLWAAIVDGVSRDDLEELLSILKKLGIGKKRNMGWGDLLEYSVYPLNSTNTLTPEYIIHSGEYLETWRPLSPEKIVKLKNEQEKKNEQENVIISLLDSKIGYGSENPPYWKRNIVVKSALFKISKK